VRGFGPSFLSFSRSKKRPKSRHGLSPSLFLLFLGAALPHVSEVDGVSPAFAPVQGDDSSFYLSSASIFFLFVF